MFLLNGSPLSPDTGFSVGGIQYPANWLRLASADEKAAIGIVEVADIARADDRFFWNGDASMPKDVDQVKAMLIGQVKLTAGSMLAQSDWYVTRKVERDVAIPESVVAKRAAIVAESERLEAAIAAAQSVQALIEVMNAQRWPTE